MARWWPGRPDGERVRDLHPGREFMPFLVRRRCEAINLFEHDVEVEAALELAEALEARHGLRVTPFVLILAALARALHEFPTLNRYVSGRRMYQRNDVAITFSGRASFVDERSDVYLRKRSFPAEESLVDVARALSGEVRRGRSGSKSGVERAMERLLKLPWPLVSLALRVVHLLDDFNLLPRRMVLDDPMYASAFVANLGSVGISGAYHSLYEHGVTPLCVVVGEVRSVPTEYGARTRRLCTLKYTYDGRIEDGWTCARFVNRVKELLEHPEELAGADLPDGVALLHAAPGRGLGEGIDLGAARA